MFKITSVSYTLPSKKHLTLSSITKLHKMTRAKQNLINNTWLEVSIYSIILVDSPRSRQLNGKSLSLAQCEL